MAIPGSRERVTTTEPGLHHSDSQLTRAVTHAQRATRGAPAAGIKPYHPSYRAAPLTRGGGPLAAGRGAAGGWLGATMPATMMLRWALATAVLLGTATAAAPRPHFVFLLIDGACGVTHLSLLPDINSPRRRY